MESGVLFIAYDNYPRTIPSKEEGIYVGQENIELWRRLWSSPQWPGEM